MRRLRVNNKVPSTAQRKELLLHSRNKRHGKHSHPSWLLSCNTVAAPSIWMWGAWSSVQSRARLILVATAITILVEASSYLCNSRSKSGRVTATVLLMITISLSTCCYSLPFFLCPFLFVFLSASTSPCYYHGRLSNAWALGLLI